MEQAGAGLRCRCSNKLATHRCWLFMPDACSYTQQHALLGLPKLGVIMVQHEPPLLPLGSY